MWSSATSGARRLGQHVANALRDDGSTTGTTTSANDRTPTAHHASFDRDEWRVESDTDPGVHVLKALGPFGRSATTQQQALKPSGAPKPLSQQGRIGQRQRGSGFDRNGTGATEWDAADGTASPSPLPLVEWDFVDATTSELVDRVAAPVEFAAFGRDLELSADMISYSLQRSVRQNFTVLLDCVRQLDVVEGQCSLFRNVLERLDDTAASFKCIFELWEKDALDERDIQLLRADSLEGGARDGDDAMASFSQDTNRAQRKVVPILAAVACEVEAIQLCIDRGAFMQAAARIMSCRHVWPLVMLRVSSFVAPLPTVRYVPHVLEGDTRESMASQRSVLGGGSHAREYRFLRNEEEGNIRVELARVSYDMLDILREGIAGLSENATALGKVGKRSPGPRQHQDVDVAPHQQGSLSGTGGRWPASSVCYRCRNALFESETSCRVQKRRERAQEAMAEDARSQHGKGGGTCGMPQPLRYVKDMEYCVAPSLQAAMREDAERGAVWSLSSVLMVGHMSAETDASALLAAKRAKMVKAQRFAAEQRRNGARVDAASQEALIDNGEMVFFSDTDDSSLESDSEGDCGSKVNESEHYGRGHMDGGSSSGIERTSSYHDGLFVPMSGVDRHGQRSDSGSKGMTQTRSEYEQALVKGVTTSLTECTLACARAIVYRIMSVTASRGTVIGGVRVLCLLGLKELASFAYLAVRRHALLVQIRVLVTSASVQQKALGVVSRVRVVREFMVHLSSVIKEYMDVIVSNNGMESCCHVAEGEGYDESDDMDDEFDVLWQVSKQQVSHGHVYRAKLVKWCEELFVRVVRDLKDLCSMTKTEADLEILFLVVSELQQQATTFARQHMIDLRPFILTLFEDSVLQRMDQRSYLMKRKIGEQVSDEEWNVMRHHGPAEGDATLAPMVRAERAMVRTGVTRSCRMVIRAIFRFIQLYAPLSLVLGSQRVVRKFFDVVGVTIDEYMALLSEAMMRTLGHSGVRERCGGLLSAAFIVEALLPRLIVTLKRDFGLRPHVLCDVLWKRQKAPMFMQHTMLKVDAQNIVMSPSMMDWHSSHVVYSVEQAVMRPSVRFMAAMQYIRSFSDSVKGLLLHTALQYTRSTSGRTSLSGSSRGRASDNLGASALVSREGTLDRTIHYSIEDGGLARTGGGVDGEEMEEDEEGEERGDSGKLQLRGRSTLCLSPTTLSVMTAVCIGELLARIIDLIQQGPFWESVKDVALPFMRSWFSEGESHLKGRDVEGKDAPVVKSTASASQEGSNVVDGDACYDDSKVQDKVPSATEDVAQELEVDASEAPFGVDGFHVFLIDINVLRLFVTKLGCHQTTLLLRDLDAMELCAMCAFVSSHARAREFIPHLLSSAWKDKAPLSTATLRDGLGGLLRSEDWVLERASKSVAVLVE